MAMSKHDQIITDLVNALGAIRHELATGNRAPFIDGIAEQAMKNCQAQQARNKDGYLVTIDDGGPAFPCPGETRDDGVQMITVVEAAPGMSLRAYIATGLVAGIYTQADITDEHLYTYRASVAVKQADALIAALKGGDRG